MRIVTESQVLEVDPGSTTSVIVDVVNNGHVIDGITARVIGLSDEFVDASPRLLPLFPDSAGQVTLALTVPKSHPAGRHPLTVEMVSHGAQLPSEYLDVSLDVAAHASLRLGVSPQVVRARRSGRFVLEIANDGNVALDVTLQAVDVDRAVTAQFSPANLRLEAGTVAPVLLDIRGPRMFTGGEIDRAVSIECVGTQPGGAHSAEDAPEPQRRQLTVRLRQRPLISRGVLGALVLAGIVVLWAAAFLLGITKVFGGDKATKAAPASFFAASADPAARNGTGNGSGNGGNGGGGSDGSGNGSGGADDAAAPADALPKSGQLPPGVGGQITGTVRAASDKQPAGRILVQAWRMATRNGRPQLLAVSSAATQTDGTYTLAGLFPTDYYLQFSASGYTSVWYPNAPSQARAQKVSTAAQGSTTDVNAVIAGKPASITGTVDPGDVQSSQPTTVTARALTSGTGTGGGGSGTTIVARAMTAGGRYTLPNLPAPGSYELTFTTPGYLATTVIDRVGGGEQRLEPTVTLGAAVGTISGTVTAGTTPLGGATVSTTVRGKPLTITTPTTGQVGSYTLANLPTPATYVITFSAPGHGAQTTIVDLGAGKSRLGLAASLAAGTGSISGQVVNPAGQGLGGATVTVGGTIGTSGQDGGLSTTTLTDGAVGTFAINGLGSGGQYTLTVTLDGYAPAVVPVRLSGTSPPTVRITLQSRLGSIAGTVRRGASGYAGATITATNGTVTRTTTSSAAGGQLGTGGYLLSNLEPGTYSVTVTAPGLRQQTRIVTVTAARTANGADLTLGG